MLNDCRAGLHGGGSAALVSDSDTAEAGESNLAQLQGSSPSARAKREAIYRSAAPTHRIACSMYAYQHLSKSCSRLRTDTRK